MLSGLKYTIVRDAAVIRVTQMGESIEDVVNSYSKLDDLQKENLTDYLTEVISNNSEEE